MRLPWQLRIVAKLVLSRMPISYDWWKWLGLFKHGAMDDPAYAEGVFLNHFERSGMSSRSGPVCMECGPGDSLFSALVANAHGASRYWLVDSGDFATRDMTRYDAMLLHLARRGLPLPPAATASLDALLAHCGARYLTGGLASLREVRTASVDLIWSHAVLEHVRKRDFDETLGEMRRILHPAGVASHRIDLHDHLGGTLNNLRLSETLWESEWMARSGFYTNRLRYSDLIARFAAAGFAVEILGVERWPAPSTPRRSLAVPFRLLPEEELLISAFDVLLRPS